MLKGLEFKNVWQICKTSDDLREV